MKKILSTESDGRLLELYGKEEGDPEIYCEGAHGFASTGAITKFNLYTVMPWDSDEKCQKRRVVARIVMPAAEFISTADLFKRIADEMREEAVPSVERSEASAAPITGSAKSVEES